MRLNPFFCKTEGMRRLTIVLSGLFFLAWVAFLAVISNGFSTINPPSGVPFAIAIPPLAAYVLVLLVRAVVCWVLRGFQTRKARGGRTTS